MDERSPWAFTEVRRFSTFFSMFFEVWKPGEAVWIKLIESMGLIYLHIFT